MDFTLRITFLLVVAVFLGACRDGTGAGLLAQKPVPGEGAQPTGDPAEDLLPQPELSATAGPMASATVPAAMATALPAFGLPANGAPGWLAHAGGDLLPTIAFSPAGNLLATGHRDGTVTLWDLATGGRVRQFTPADGTAGAGEVAALAFSPDGALLAAARPASGSVELWQVAAGTHAAVLAGREGLQALAFTPDGRLLAGGVARGNEPSALGTVYLWNRESGTLLQQLDDVGADVAFADGGATLLTASGVALTAMAGAEIEPGAVVFWDATSGQRLRTLPLNGYVAAIAYHPGRQLLAVNLLESIDAAPGYASHTLLVSVPTGETVQVLALPAEGGQLPLFVDEVAFSPDGSLVAVSYQPNRLAVWDVALGQRLLTVDGPADTLRDPTFSPDGRLLAASSSDGRILFWQIAP